MSGTEISLIAVTAGFILLLVWVYAPSRKRQLESYGAMPLDDEQPGRQRERADEERT